MNSQSLTSIIKGKLNLVCTVLLNDNPSNIANSGDWGKGKIESKFYRCNTENWERKFSYNEKLFSLCYSILPPTCLWCIHNKAYETWDLMSLSWQWCPKGNGLPSISHSFSEWEYWGNFSNRFLMCVNRIVSSPQTDSKNWADLSLLDVITAESHLKRILSMQIHFKLSSIVFYILKIIRLTKRNWERKPISSWSGKKARKIKPWEGWVIFDLISRSCGSPQREHGVGWGHRIVLFFSEPTTRIQPCGDGRPWAKLMALWLGMEDVGFLWFLWHAVWELH